jgi:predicted ester cyclase
LPSGPDAFKLVIGMWRAAFPDWHMTIETLVAEGDFVANRFTTRGTHKAPLMGIPATGKQMVVHGMELHRIAGGKVAETWVCDDVPSIMQQLGIGPPVPIPR